MSTTTTDNGPAIALRSLVLRAAEPGMLPAERAAKARRAGSELADLRDLARVGAILPGRVLDVMKADRGDAAAQERVAAAGAVFEARAVATQVSIDMPGLITKVGVVPAVAGSLGDGVPLVRLLATPWTDTGLPMIPAAPSGSLVGEVVTQGVAQTGAGFFAIGDVEVDRWTMAAAYGEVAKQVFDFSSDDGRLLDDLYELVADRGAEVNIGSRLVAAGTSAAAGADLGAALDTAESLASAALLAPADLVLVNVADLPRVRRAVAASWQSDPHPILLPTMGVPAGKVVVTGRSAFTLLARPHDLTVDRDAFERLGDSLIQAVRPRTWSLTVAVLRHFILAIRNAGGVRVVTL